jgi:hypothetical protein
MHVLHVLRFLSLVLHVVRFLRVLLVLFAFCFHLSFVGSTVGFLEDLAGG